MAGDLTWAGVVGALLGGCEVQTEPKEEMELVRGEWGEFQTESTASPDIPRSLGGREELGELMFGEVVGEVVGGGLGKTSRHTGLSGGEFWFDGRIQGLRL